MRKVSVEVLEDASHPEGGYAVLLLRDVASLPDGVTFRLKPVEARGGNDEAASRAWPQGDLTPRLVRRGTGGMELLVGPEIVEARALIPGTLGVIEVKAAGVRGEFLWPSIKPTARPRRRNLTVVKPTKPTLPSSPRTAKSSHAGGAMPLAVSLDGGAHTATAAAGSALREEAAEIEATRVTALDHDVPAAPSIAEAVGGNVVQLNVARDKDIAAGTGPAAQDRDADRANGENVAKPWAAARRFDPAARRTVVIAASLAMLVFSGAYLFGRKPAADDQVVVAKREPSRMLSRVETVEVTERVVVSRGAAVEEMPQLQVDQAPPAQQPASIPALQAETAREAVTAFPQQPSAPPAEVTLRMRGGGFQIAGELKGFDGTKYVIATRSAGELTMDASRFECIGEPCGRPATAILPLSERPSPVKPDVFRIEGAPSLAGEFIAQLIRDYANSIGATVSAEGRDAGKAVRYRINDTRGAELASIEVGSGGTASGLQALERGAAAIALVDRPFVLEAEARTATADRRRVRPAAATQPTEIVVGLDGIVAVVAPGSPLGSLSLDNLVKVASGQITDWYELGQQPGAISLYLPPDGSGSIDAFTRQMLKPRGLDFARSARRLPSESDAADAAVRDPRGIAIVSLAAQRQARPVNMELQCGLVVRPSSFTVKTGEYPLLRRLSLQLPPQLAQPSARGLVRIAQSGELTNALGAGRIVDPSLASLPIEEQGERMAWAANAPPSAFDAAELRQMLADLGGASRLSTTFRFVPGTNELDQRSRRELQRLAAALKEPELAGKRILLAGFTDGAGRFQANMAASARRAGQVRSALLAAAPGFDGRLLQGKGYGPLAPVGCNGTPEGTRLNRRVEVWVTR